MDQKCHTCMLQHWIGASKDGSHDKRRGELRDIVVSQKYLHQMPHYETGTIGDDTERGWNGKWGAVLAHPRMSKWN